MIYAYESDLSTAKHLGLNYRTYLKYRQISISTGCLTPLNGGHYQAKSITDCLQLLGLDLSHCNFFKDCEYGEGLTFMKVYDRIKLSIIERNLDQQFFAISKRKQLLTSSRYKVKKQLMKMAASEGLSTEQFTKRIEGERGYAVTGKFHAAELIKMSTGSGRRMVNKLKSIFFVGQNIVKTSFPSISETYDLVRGCYSGFIYASKGYWCVNMGTKIYGKRLSLTN